MCSAASSNAVLASAASQRQSPPGMHVDVAYEEAASAAERDLRLERMVEILAGNDIEVIGHARLQRVRKVDLLA
jgi:hypothetical protein